MANTTAEQQYLNGYVQPTEMEDESESDDEHESEKCCSYGEGVGIAIILVAWGFGVLMILAFQVSSYRQAVEGDSEVTHRIYIAGWMGVLFAVSLCFALVRFSTNWPRVSVAAACVMVAFIVAFFTMMNMHVKQDFELIGVDTTLSIRPDCARGKLVDVSEMLTYKIEAPKLLNATYLTSVTRVLNDQVVPSNVTVEGLPPLTNVRIANMEESLPQKFDPSYSSTLPKRIVKIAFDRLFSEYGQADVIFSVRLKYTARLIEIDCSKLGAAQCGQWYVPEVKHDEVSSKLSVLCDGLGAPSVTTLMQQTCGSVMRASKGSYDIRLNLPTLEIGSKACPFAWKKPVQSWVWYIGACLLSVGFFFMSCSVYAGRQGVACCVPGLFFVCLGGLVCLIAMGVDAMEGNP
eukprot:TRINITY_DN1637_c0_g7_i1.p1 TRINITY_DN1637_c0_g7~~TRINITY_DN1637_c0_g7_i1.p1  ORF type:complete len:404 (-),score=50.38 TRINITY_DN1637_c0_g7_i1:214-1425(-)